ncbi:MULTISPECIES: TonB-dependent receptor [unclassified Zobellia]|uniref:SusC/RagA family TonB-linked outer membrane protein n=1 Tax=unclassified Zobellia TaxID=2620635 RepID=UPI001C070B01|nr:MULTISPECIES: TonB-dependent receptor [unclassified Zobellia]MBU2975156.1 TonB-dependent receptor [Zobellia sp. B3R18]MDO6817934.1 TonB-dependent receptor [Zobellia sp. 1_MG-2023]
MKNKEELLFSAVNSLVRGPKKILATAICLLTLLNANAEITENENPLQQPTISGTVYDDLGEPLPGASIVLKGTTVGTTSDFDGNFTLQAEGDQHILSISYIGYKTKEIDFTDKTSVEVTMETDAAALDEIVVVGYSSQKRATVTGAISTLKGAEIAEVPAANISQSLAGRMAGVSMRPNGGTPGNDNPDIHIRGIVTTGNNKPLVVVDGIRRDNIGQIDPSVIETITVLKDAAAVAPFGIGGSNGVILITTKKGKSGKPVVSINTSYAFQKPTYLPEMLNAQDYMALQNEGYFNLNPDGTTPPNDPDLIANYPSLHKQDPYRYPDANFPEIFKKNSGIQITNAEISGGTENIQYHAGLGYYDQSGIFEPLGYKRYSYNLNIDANLSANTKVGMSLLGTIENTDGIDADETPTHLMRSFYKFVPTQTLLYPEGDKWGESSANTPVGVLRSDGYNREEDNTLLSSVYLEQQLPFIEGLSVKGVFSFDNEQGNDKLWHVPYKYHNIDLTQQPYTYTEAISLQEGNGAPYTWLQLKNERLKKFTYQGYINYNRTIGDHAISGLFVAEARETKGDYFNTRRNNFAIEIDELSLGSSDKLDYDNEGSSNTASELGYVYRLGYTYKNKYIFEASGRYDGHYSFAPGNRWGYFPAFSGAWRISEEKFMQNVNNVNNLKLRGSWGKSGNLPYIDDELADFQYLAGYDLRGNAYAYGNGVLVQGSKIENEPNPNITWEISTKLDIGFDLTMYNGLLNVEFDYFHEDRTGMLLTPQVTLPVEYGLALSQENKGEMNNDGFEFSIGTQKQWDNGLQLSINANMSYSENNMIEVFQSDAERDNPNRTKVGRPFGTPYGYKSLGLFSTADDINNDGIINATDGYNVEQFGDLHPGDVRYADLSGPDGVPDGKIDSNDQTVIGKPVYPSTTYGLNSSVSYKGFDLSLFFQGTAGSDINIQTFLTSPFANNGSNTSYEYFNNRWTPDNQGARYPRATPSPYSNNTQDSDFWIVDTSYLRLKTASLGYSLPQTITEKLNVSSIGFTLTAQNLFTISKLDFIDPELGYDDRENSYPIMKSLAFGMNISF